MKEEPFPSEKIFNLDTQAKELGMGGKLSTESDEISYKKRMQKRKDIEKKYSLLIENMYENKFSKKI